MDKPIGIFDSGVGGLTVASAIKKFLPNESFIYFGDTKHSPYGDKSGDTIRGYSSDITNFLLAKNCKAIVIACNTASALAYDDLILQHPNIPIVNVVDPVAEFVAKQNPNKIGIIATRATTKSKIYKRRLLEINPDLKIEDAATPLLVGLVEEGFMNTELSRGAIKQYLKHPKFKNLDSIILGCTHFPLLQKEIESFFQGKTHVVDSPELVAKELAKVLKAHKILSETKGSQYHFYVSEKTGAFSKIAKNFFGENIQLKEKQL